MPVSRIVAVGHHQPTRVLTNADLEAMVDTSDAWIRQRTGIATRRIAGSQESVTDLAAAAGAKAVAAAGLEPGQIDHSLRAGAAEHALVIGAEKMSDVTDWTDRSTCVLLGDRAGAAVLSSGSGSGTPIGPVVWGSDPTRADAVRLVDAWQPRFAQEGQSVFRWATGELPALAEQACHRAGITPADLAGVVTHQANLRIIESLVGRLGLRPDAVIARDVVESGNTSAASVPLALSKLLERDELPSGAPVLLFAFGGGLSWAGQVVTCP